MTVRCDNATSLNSPPDQRPQSMCATSELWSSVAEWLCHPLVGYSRSVVDSGQQVSMNLGPQQISLGLVVSPSNKTEIVE